jgi:hypothetical protein
MNATGELEVVPAVMWTGDVTLAFAAGVQIVTLGLAGLRGHCAPAIEIRLMEMKVKKKR